MDPLRVLLVAYAFPPVGGAGVQRVLKLAKYLPSAGIAPTVLTASNPSVPVLDESLARQLPATVDIVRARTFEPGYGLKAAAWDATATKRPSHDKRPFRKWIMSSATAVAKQLLIPDPQVLWLPAAQLALARRIARRADDAILITAPPFSQFLLAPLARVRVPVVLDYRDEWSTYRAMYEMMGSALGNAIGETLEARMLRLASAVTTATEEFRENLLAKFRFLDPGRVVFIPNGYDPDDFPSDLPDPPADRFVVTYAGTVFKLTSAAGFLAAVRLIHERSPALAARLDVRFIGRIVDTELASFEGTPGVQRLGYQPHATAMQQLSASHLNLCILDAVDHVEHIYPAKIFELMYLGRPVLTLSPEGALTRLVERHALGTVLPPRDAPAIASFLERSITAHLARPSVPRSGAQDIERFDRRATTRRFADLLRTLA